MRTRCKFVVQSVEKFQGNQETVKMTAITGDVGENKSFSQWTPSGALNFTVTNPEVIGKYEPGQLVYIDIIPCE